VAAARFLQISDLHLGAPFGWLAPERRTERRREQQRALEDAVAEAVRRRVDAILIAGDLFDREGVDAQTLAFAVRVFDPPGCPPVFIAPGNHDPWSLSSPFWNARLLEARGWSWPEHVHVFTSARWTGCGIPGSPIEVWGRSFTTGIPSAERPLDTAMLADVPRDGGTALRVGVFHGSREGFLPPGQITAGPFSDEEALLSPFVYLAAGHYHVRSRLDHAGSARLAYAGSPIALTPGELGDHGALEVRIDRDRVETEFVELDRRRVHELSVDVSGAVSEDQVDRRILAALDAAGIRDRDLATVRLSGRLPRGVRCPSPGAELAARLFHLRIDPGAVRPDHDLDSLRRGSGVTTEERFARTLLERLEREDDPDQLAVIESALYYGLDALRLREVTPGYEELGR
jgi:DNA repair exonuclease SbcCD nuclease subunit